MMTHSDVGSLQYSTVVLLLYYCTTINVQ